MDASPFSTADGSPTAPPTAAELQAELLDVPEPPEAPPTVEPPGFDEALATALRYVRAKRGGDLVGIILVGSGARKNVTAHSDIDLIVLVKGAADGQEYIRVGDRLVDIRYGEHKTVGEDIEASPRLAPLLRKGRVLYDHEGIAGKLVDKAAQRFRQGPAPTSLHEQIRLKADCLHLLGKVEDMLERPTTAHYLLQIFFEECVTAFFRIRGLWLTSPVDVLRFMASRDQALGDAASQFLSAATLHNRLNCGRRFADILFKDVPLPPRVD
ncbi:MAG TPA: nucleotidyltransferase domain-containing protein [Nitrospiraceae bacterium]|jgi:predicted nucleotidyltransferase|nr:nucleotidyltransferase domain-containing protein [Nitrospiraceae bacterium]